MSIFQPKAKAPAPEGDALSAGTHAAVLVAIIDLGTHTEEFQGVSKDHRCLYFVWEIPAEKACFGKVYHTAEELSSKSSLRLMLENWRGKKYGAGEAIDSLACLGKSCLLTITHKQSGERSYPQLAGVSNVVKGTPPVKPSTQPYAWSIDEDVPVPEEDWLPWCFCGGARSSVKDAIAASNERRPGGTQVPAPAAQPNGVQSHSPAHAEEIPF